MLERLGGGGGGIANLSGVRLLASSDALDGPLLAITPCECGSTHPPVFSGCHHSPMFYLCLGEARQLWSLAHLRRLLGSSRGSYSRLVPSHEMNLSCLDGHTFEPISRLCARP